MLRASYSGLCRWVPEGSQWGDEILPAHLPLSMARPEAGLDQPAGVAGHRSLREALDAFEANYIRRVLADCGGNRTRAAETLGIGRKHLWTKMQQLALDGDPKS